MNGFHSCRCFLASALLLLTFSTVGEVAAQQLHEHSGWMVGVSYGLGKGRFRDATGNETEIRDGVSPQWRIGKFLSQRWLLNFEYEGWLIENGDVDLKYRRSLQNFLLAITWYPGNPRNYWGGLYIRFGTGIGLGGTAFVQLEEQEQMASTRYDETGPGVLFGVGYQFRITRALAAGLAVSSNYLNIEGDFIHEAWFAPLTLDLSWFF